MSSGPWETHRPENPQRGMLATSTVTGILAVLRSALGTARARGYLRFNPAYGVLRIRPAIQGLPRRRLPLGLLGQLARHVPEMVQRGRVRQPRQDGGFPDRRRGA